MKPARYIVTWAQDRTPVHKDFLACLHTYSAKRNAMIVVIPGMYKNPTSRFDDQYEDGEWAEEIQPYLSDEREQLAPNLVLYGDIRIQPTAQRPLTGFEVFCSGHSAIFGHPKRALDTVPTATRMPRILTTTGAVTVPNYSSTRAGKRGDAHHVLGAVAVDIDAKGFYFIRNVTYDVRTKSFTDLDSRYSADKVVAAPRAASLTFGDVHVGQKSTDGKPERGAKKLFDLVRPMNLVLHDVLDFRTRNHHDKGFVSKFRNALLKVQDEVLAACDAVADFDSWGDHETHVVRSNHDEALERWVEEYREREDAINAPFWHLMRLWQLRQGVDNLFAEVYRHRHETRPVHFLKRNEALTIKGVGHGFHGDKGPNGSRGTRKAYVRLAVKVVRGHGHAPGIEESVFDAGVYGSLDHGYNSLPSNWANAHVVTHADSKRQLIFVIDGRVAA